MPTLHLTKVAFACRDLDMLQQRVALRALGGELRVATRMRPKRAAEVVGGSLYWIVKHRLVACQQILRFEDPSPGRIYNICPPELAAFPPRPRRAHQGWRYLEDADAPHAGDEDASGLTELPPQLYGRLAALALV